MTDHNKGDDFWDLSEYSKKIGRSQSIPRSFAPGRTSAVEISDSKSTQEAFYAIDPSDTMITKFIPPHSDANFTKKNIIYEYEPENPLIKKVTIYSDKAGEELFVKDNLFIRERRALIDRTTTFKEPVPFYSYAPRRYSQLNKAQLNWYIWWRQNARNGTFIKTDESYVMLYAYELAATDEGEDKTAALGMLCSLLTKFSSSELGIVYKIMIRDIICDFCLIHRLPSPVHLLVGVERQVLFGSFLPEFFIDFSQSKEHCAPLLASMSLYDYRRSKCYTEENAAIFKKGIDGAISAVINSPEAFDSITSFTRGVYGDVTADRHPFIRMANIVNKNVKLEIVYYELSNLKSAVTDAVRYSENKIRDHLGIRSKIHVLTVNPHAREAIDSFFADNLPAHQFIDKRRKDARVQEESHDYDKLYDLPKKEISPERALEIERESWDTTKKLTEAFEETENVEKIPTEPVKEPEKPIMEEPLFIPSEPISEANDLYSQLLSKLGSIAQFINLCKGSSLAEQRKFASSHNSTADEISDKINEAAAELFGDIILENDSGAYTIIEDYLFLFN